MDVLLNGMRDYGFWRRNCVEKRGVKGIPRSINGMGIDTLCSESNVT